MTKVVLFILTFILCFSNCNKKDKQVLRIATAANMQYAIDSLITVFEETTSIDCEAIIGSSGKLTAQIMQGAPFDVFVAADMKYPLGLYESGHTTQPPKAYASGKLILWTMHDEVVLSLDKLAIENINHIAIANPKTAPYGAAALEVLNQLDETEKINNKLVYGESIAQTNQFIVSKAAEIGLTAMTVIHAPHLQNKGRWIAVADSLYTPINQGIILLEHKEGNSIEAEQFYDFLFSEKAINILNAYGYLTSDD